MIGLVRLPEKPTTAEQIELVKSFAAEQGYQIHNDCSKLLKDVETNGPVLGLEIPCELEANKPYPELATNTAYALHVQGVDLPQYEALPHGTTLLAWPELLSPCC